MNLPTSELAWKLVHYQAAGIEPPARCISHPSLTEGEMMSTEEVEEYIKDSITTLRILADKRSPRHSQVAQAFAADMAYLVQVGSLDADQYVALTSSKNLHF
jgi:hypothetical protein